MGREFSVVHVKKDGSMDHARTHYPRDTVSRQNNYIGYFVDAVMSRRDISTKIRELTADLADKVDDDEAEDIAEAIRAFAWAFTICPLTEPVYVRYS